MDNVFFGNDRFELMVDTRGYRPEELKCTVGPNTIEITAQKQEVSAGAQRILETARSYQLPQLVVPQQAVCCLSSEGLLLIVVPWQK
ncbi:HSP20 domain containing protein [Asbolus verrucosus]|uniref:HSP20 domain containing protein n=1 Tax=Asbolus verrucosus TaxID=1661398 RepID=A0A482VVD3_ASBVE|nr:HSP20 domain containing protein [Asbolus verrucosus]